MSRRFQRQSAEFRPPAGRRRRAARPELEGIDETLVAQWARAEPEAILRSLARSSDETRALVFHRLQKTCGNASIQRLVRQAQSGPVPDTAEAAERQVDTQLVLSSPVEATIQRKPEREDASVSRPGNAVSALAADAPPGKEKQVEHKELAKLVERQMERLRQNGREENASPAGEQQSGGSATPTPQSQPGSPVRLPDIEIPELKELESTDGIKSSIGYNATIARASEIEPDGFGVTKWADIKLKSVTVTPTPFAYRVNGVAEHTVKWQVRERMGPDQEVDITSVSDPKIRADNYADVARDLAPDRSDLGGRPARERFWSSDLTIRHEKFHAEDVTSRAPLAVIKARAWLSDQPAWSVDGVRDCLEIFPEQVVDSMVTLRGSKEDVERRAYEHGAPAYAARAAAIAIKGQVGLYG